MRDWIVKANVNTTSMALYNQSLCFIDQLHSEGLIESKQSLTFFAKKERIGLKI